MRHLYRAAMFAAFVATVYGANWALARLGLVPVGFGLMAPAGVYFAGLAFGLRDALHELGGSRLVVAAIAVGTALSYVIEDAVQIPGGHVSIAVASAVAFGLSELADLCVYSPLRQRHWTAAVLASGAAGAVVDSGLFLWLAFGSLENITGLLLGKAYMIALALPVVWWARRSRSETSGCDSRTATAPAPASFEDRGELIPAHILERSAHLARQAAICWACDGATDETVHTCRA
jgi:uncharacterized PurR-regulated membrane protein YhhQ (DUF165 family)